MRVCVSVCRCWVLGARLCAHALQAAPRAQPWGWKKRVGKCGVCRPLKGWRRFGSDESPRPAPRPEAPQTSLQDWKCLGSLWRQWRREQVEQSSGRARTPRLQAGRGEGAPILRREGAGLGAPRTRRRGVATGMGSGHPREARFR